MVKIDKKFVKSACKIVFEDLGFYSHKKYRTDFVNTFDFYDCLFNKFPFLLDDDDLFDDFTDLLFDSVLNSLHFNCLNSISGDSFFVPFRKKSIIKLVDESNGLYHIFNDIVIYLSNGKKVQCYLYQLH